jgi:hypothetical protein
MNTATGSRPERIRQRINIDPVTVRSGVEHSRGSSTMGWEADLYFMVANSFGTSRSSCYSGFVVRQVQVISRGYCAY